MKHIKLALLALLAVASNAHSTELYLNTIKNKTGSNVQWEKLPLPGLLGKMRPVTIPEGKTTQPNMPIIPPVILSFKNSDDLTQAVFVNIQLQTSSPKEIRYNPDAPKKRERSQLILITIKDSNNKIITRRLVQVIKPGSRYLLNINLKGDSLQNTTAKLIEQEQERSTWDV